jgi:GT2 family glycosyltransferase
VRQLKFNFGLKREFVFRPFLKANKVHFMLYIIITDFNGYAQTRRCLQALAASTYQKFKIIVVDHGDNDDNDDTQQGLAQEFPHVMRLIGSPQHWWAGANNIGIRAALAQGAQTIMLLNNDCYVTPDTLSLLLEAAAQHPNAIVAPIQRDWQSGRLTTITPRACFLLGFPTLAGSRRLTPAMQKRQLLPVKLIIGGRGVIIPAKLFRQVGALDEQNLPHYGSDHDFYLRARQQGVSLYTLSQAYVDIDNTRTSLADNPASLNLRQFWNSLSNRRSHRNITDIWNLFKRHYPIPYLYPLGVTLYLGRYILIYALKRSKFLLLKCATHQRQR